MRMIGYVESEPGARTFSDYLYVKGIKNQVEADANGQWAIWIHGEDEIEQARALLRSYIANPSDPAVRQAAERARELQAQAEAQAAAAEKRYFTSDRVFKTGGLWAAAPLTFALIAVSVAVYVLREYSSVRWLTDYLFISDSEAFNGPLVEVRQGQVWRLFTPVFLHFGVLHILFNMLWMRDLGSIIERSMGTLKLLLLVVVIGVASNIGQYYASGPNFGGMSGVVYGLLGYVWMRGKFDPSSGLFLHPSTVTMMLIWLVFGYTNILPMANTVHTIGLAIGVAWGFLAAKVR